MLREIIIKTVLTIIGFIVTTTLGYLVAKVKEYRKKLKDKANSETIQNMALQALLKGQLTNTYFVYNELQKIPDYVYQNFLEMLKVYEELGGNGFIHSIAKKMENWQIVKTDIL